MQKSFASLWDSTFRRITQSKNYLPEVDGIRAFAVIIVVFFHINGYLIKKNGLTELEQRTWVGLLESGWVGVELFFAISGFVLFLPFADRAKKHAPWPDMKWFYARRFIRVFPPFAIAMTLAYLGILFLGTSEGGPVSWKNYLATLTYSHNWWFHRPSRIVVVAWTLEIEVQFYLLAPLVALLFRFKARPRRLVAVALGLCSMAKNMVFGFGDVADLSDFLGYFMVGFLWADFYVEGYLNEKRWLWDGVGLVGLISIYYYAPISESNYALLVVPVALAMWGLSSGKLFSYILSTRIVMLVGVSCYSGYLLHYPLISIVGRLIKNVGRGRSMEFIYWSQAGIMAAAYAVVVILFYVLVERRFMAPEQTTSFLKVLANGFLLVKRMCRGSARVTED